MKHRRMRVLALALAAVLACAPQTFAATLDELKQQQSQLEQEQEENQQKLDALKADQSKQQEYKDALDAQVQNLQSQIDALNTQISGLDASISEKDDAIAEKQRSIVKEVVKQIFIKNTRQHKSFLHSLATGSREGGKLRERCCLPGSAGPFCDCLSLVPLFQGTSIV